MLEIKKNLDKRICDCEPGASNKQTYRQFFMEGYKDIGPPIEDENYLDNCTNEDLNELLEELDWLLEK